MLLVYLLQRIQVVLPGDLGLPAVGPSLAFNTAASFVSNTNWQSYSPEVTLGYSVQMAGLAVQNFLSAAVGLAVAVALVRGFARRHTGTLGNVWVDVVRGTGRLLLPRRSSFAIVLVAGGVVQSWGSGTDVTTLVGGTQHIPDGFVASQEAIKELGTNGGGYFNANSAHPFENPQAWTNLVEVFLMLVIPFSLPRTFGRHGRRPPPGVVEEIVRAEVDHDPVRVPAVVVRGPGLARNGARIAPGQAVAGGGAVIIANDPEARKGVHPIIGVQPPGEQGPEGLLGVGPVVDLVAAAGAGRRGVAITDAVRIADELDLAGAAAGGERGGAGDGPEAEEAGAARLAFGQFFQADDMVAGGEAGDPHRHRARLGQDRARGAVDEQPDTSLPGSATVTPVPWKRPSK